MPRLVINGISVETPQGATLLEAAASLDLRIPTLCHAPGIHPQTSCMVCVVEDTRTGRLVPSCAAAAEAGMAIETDSERVRLARRGALEMLLSEHVGDCEAPCERACPAGLNIPLMLRLLARRDAGAAGVLAREALVLPAVLGRVCTAPCEVVCRRGVLDEALAIRELHGRLGETLASSEEIGSHLAAASGKKVAVIGSGPAGLAAAFRLRGYGHACTVYEKQARAGGMLLDFPEEQLPREILEQDIAQILQSGVDIVFNTEVGSALTLERLFDEVDAVVVACSLAAPERPGLFRAEDKKTPVRSVASGKAAAEAVHALLMQGAGSTCSPYQSMIGRLTPEQTQVFAEGRIPEAALARRRNVSEPEREAERCLHCDCHAPVSCKLRQYATEYDVRPAVFRRAGRPDVSGVQRHGNIIFDVGKCIKCGLCVEITQARGEPFGMTLTGRGFAMEVCVPLGEPLEQAFSTCAAECIAACPTGALAFEPEEERNSEQLRRRREDRENRGV